MLPFQLHFRSVQPLLQYLACFRFVFTLSRQPGLDTKSTGQLLEAVPSIYICLSPMHSHQPQHVIYLSQTTIHAIDHQLDPESCRLPPRTASRNIKIEIVVGQVPHIALRPFLQEPPVPDRYDHFSPAASSRQEAHPRHAILGQHCLDRTPIVE